MSKQAGPGWYPDPDQPGMVRWWEGERWLDMQMPASMAPQAPSASNKFIVIASTLAKAWFWLILLAFFLFVIWALVF